jgi:hypothetical protein
MLEEQEDAIEEIRTEEEETMDVTMADEEQTPTNGLQKQQETLPNTNSAAMAEGDFDHQFSTTTKGSDKLGNNTPETGVNRQ